MMERGQNTYSVYNKSSEDMREVPSGSVDLVIFAPPYNIDTPYSSVAGFDSKSFEEYKRVLGGVIDECVRALKPTGLFLNESADSVYSDDKLIALSGLIQRRNGVRTQYAHN
jgi:DNA modification methylase